MDEEQIKPTESHNYYDNEYIFWTNFSAAALRQARWTSGAADKGWVAHLTDLYGLFDKALFMNCGNGWVERACFQQGLIREALGFDIMPHHLQEARAQAIEIGMPAEYIKLDANRLDLPWQDFPLAINNGAVHHIAYIDQFLRKLRSAMSRDGIYVIMDYTGPHRNQYPWSAWERVLQINADLPVRFRKKLRYPHMPTMLALDPSEAVHSELQMEVTRRYFEVEREVKFGGGIGYELLFGNKALLAEQHSPEGARAIAMILDEDEKLLAECPQTNLFTFAICRPKADALCPKQLENWERDENERESIARSNNGRYYPQTGLELIYNEIAYMDMGLPYPQT